ncbi:MAG: cytochrome b5 domain-containing protein [Vicinamibacterales bacterium]
MSDSYLSEAAGFLPIEPPRLHLPPGFAAWDGLASDLVTRVAQLRVAEAVRQLPPYDADDLPATDLNRAALLLGVFMHAAWREQQLVHVTPSVPTSLRRAWEVVCSRLGRPGPGLTYSDLFLYNWRLRDPSLPRVAENMDLLAPVFGSEEERRFYLVMTESHAVATPLVGSVLALERALAERADAEVERELERIRAVLDVMTFDTLLKVDPNPYSPSFVDHLIWSKTVAPFAFPVTTGELGLSGGGSPVFHVLDALFDRVDWRSAIGAELVALREWMGADVIHFIQRTARLKLRSYVATRPRLHAAYHQAREAYTGQRGWLGLHRLKVYGFMEVAFRAGRTQTNGGFSGRVADRAWEALDDELERARLERGPASRCPMARQAGIRPAAHAPVFHVEIDTPLHGRPGDRLGIWPRNASALVQRTLDALGATGHERFRLTAEWRATLEALTDEPVGDVVALKTFLAFAKLRPVPRVVGKRLLALSFVPALHDVLERRHEDHYELWEVLALMAAQNYDTRRLWRAAPWHSESLARILPAEQPRVYSISSAPPHRTALTVGQLSLVSAQLGTDTAIERHGTGSHFLTTTNDPFPADVVRPSRFVLPDPRRPVVMFAAGSGISPFRGFWQARREVASLTWLLATVRDRGSLPYASELKAEIATHGLDVHVTCSREDVEMVANASTFETRPASRSYLDRIIALHADRLWTLLQSEEQGGLQASFYVCGQTRLAHTVLTALEAVVAAKLAAAPDSLGVREFFRHLVAEGRLMMDVFTTFAPRDAPGPLPFQLYDASDLIEHNNDSHGYWCAIAGLVYDVTEFQWRHPGGFRLLRLNAGIDATRSYEKVNHHLNAEVEASLDLYKIGKIRRLTFGHRWAATLLPDPEAKRPDTATARADGLLYYTLHDLYRHWMRYVFGVVEIENAFAGNCDLGRSPRLVSTPPGSPLHRWFDIEILRVFGEMFVEQLMGRDLNRLWHLQLGMCSPGRPLMSLELQLSAIRPRARALFEEMTARHCAQFRAGTPAHGQPLDAALAFTSEWLASYKDTLRGAIRLFERHEVHTVDAAGTELTATLAGVPARMTGYIEGLESILHGTGRRHDTGAVNGT